MPGCGRVPPRGIDVELFRLFGVGIFLFTCLAVGGKMLLLARRTKQAPELMDQYAQAFEKVWAHRKELA